MNRIIVFSLVLLCSFSEQVQAQQLSPEEKAQQAAEHMQKRLGLKEKQIEQIYSLNLSKIQKVRTVKTEKAANYKKLDRHYEAISEEYNWRLRSVLTPEQYQRWELLRAEAIERRKVIQTNLLADNRTSEGEALIDPETELEHLVTH
ncbi:MAG: hypothetical protein JWM14_2003 [Chitinophagaceae bacterium]|nr:hypothetical protein [Chitinophagaceae bacterium]